MGTALEEIRKAVNASKKSHRLCTTYTGRSSLKESWIPDHVTAFATEPIEISKEVKEKLSNFVS